MLGVGLLLVMNAGLVAAICYAFHRMKNSNNSNTYNNLPSPSIPSYPVSTTSPYYGSISTLPSQQPSQSQQDDDRALLY